ERFSSRRLRITRRAQRQRSESGAKRPRLMQTPAGSPTNTATGSIHPLKRLSCHTIPASHPRNSRKSPRSKTRRAPSAPVLQHVTTACHHCVEPGCLHGCPVLAYEKDPVTGIVRHLDDQCIGCTYCVLMCPYEVPQ